MQKSQGDFYAVSKVPLPRGTFLQAVQKTHFDSKVRIQRAFLTFLHPAVNSFAVNSEYKTQPKVLLFLCTTGYADAFFALDTRVTEPRTPLDTTVTARSAKKISDVLPSGRVVTAKTREGRSSDSAVGVQWMLALGQEPRVEPLQVDDADD